MSERKPLEPGGMGLDAEPAFLEVEPLPPVSRTGSQPAKATPSEPPPPVERILEALLFAGGPPLTPEAAAQSIRGLSVDDFRAAVASLNKCYRQQNRPYTIVPQGAGFAMSLRPAFRHVREKLHGGPREARLSQPALDVLSVIAYRQPVSKADVDTARGSDSGSLLRQLVRLGMIVARGKPAVYSTTPRFLELFNLTGLDDLPRLADVSG